MRFELFVAMRYLRAKRKQAFASIISVISILGVGLGVASLIVAMGVMNGFTSDLRDKILSASSQIIIYNKFIPITDPEELCATVAGVPGVEAATPFVYTELMLSAPGGVKGVMLRGVESATAPKVITMLSDLKFGKIEYLDEAPEEYPPGPGIIIGYELAKRFGLEPGDRVNLLSPTGTRSTAGFAPRIRPFTVVGIFATGMVEYDTSLAFTSLDGARDITGMGETRVSGVEVTTRDVFTADKTAQAIAAVLGPDYMVNNWMETNRNLFAALKLEKLAMGIVLTLIILVASFSIITTLVMLVMEKTRDIAIMMSMGATGDAVRRIFTYQGMIIGFVGTSLGFFLGLLISFLLKRYQFIKLPAGVYPVDYVPILLNVSDLVLIGIGAMLICYVATIYPARKAAQLVPAEALHYE